MRIAIASALYPPDTATQALYVKELSRRLSEGHTVSLLVYSEIPEEVPGVTIKTVSKKRPRAQRLFLYTQKLFTTASEADVLYIQNGASVEVPALIVSLFTSTPIILGVSDVNAFKKNRQSSFAYFLFSLLQKRTSATIEAMPLLKPEILPFQKVSIEKQEEYENSWNTHLALLNKAIT